MELPFHLTAGFIVGDIQKGGMEMKEIQLTQGYITLVDDEDYDWLNQWKWTVIKQGNSGYAYRGIRVDGKNKTVRMHRLIMDAPKGMDIDHIDGNGLNNQRSNLRIVTRRQNNQNRHDKRTSIYPGVEWYERDEKWRATIRYKGKKIRLGIFKSEINAFRAYYDAVLELGEEVLAFPYPDIPKDEIEVYIPNNSNKPKPVMGISVDSPDNTIFFNSASEAGRNGFKQSVISACCRGKHKNGTHKGYRWQWAS